MTTQDGLVEDDPQRKGLVAGEPLLTFHPDRDPPVDLVIVKAGVGRPEHGTGILGRLQQAGNDLRLELLDAHRAALRGHEPLEPARHGVWKAVPPVLLAGVPHQVEQLAAHVLVRHPVVVQQFHNIAGPVDDAASSGSSRRTRPAPLPSGDAATSLTRPVRTATASQGNARQRETPCIAR